MSSGIFVTIKLDPFLQQFLCGHFKRDIDNFSFPNNAILGKAMVNVLRTLPEDYEDFNFGESTFKIEIPFNRDRDPFYYRYMSPTAQTAFATRIKDYFEFVFHERMAELRRHGYWKKDSVSIFIDENNLSIKNYDRLIKDFQRWRKKISNQNYEKKKLENPQKRTSKKQRVLSCA